MTSGYRIFSMNYIVCEQPGNFQLKEGQIKVVVGCGPIGAGIMKFAQIAGAKVIALDINEERLQYAEK